MDKIEKLYTKSQNRAKLVQKVHSGIKFRFIIFKKDHTERN